MRSSLNYIFLILFVLLAGCSAPQAGCIISIDNNEIPGRYVANHKDALLDMIDIGADGTYTYQYKTENGDDDINYTSTWVVGEYEGFSGISFKNFLIPFPRGRDSNPLYRKSADWYVEPERALTGRIRLPLDPDRGYYYVKQKP